MLRSGALHIGEMGKSGGGLNGLSDRRERPSKTGPREAKAVLPGQAPTTGPGSYQAKAWNSGAGGHPNRRAAPIRASFPANLTFGLARSTQPHLLPARFDGYPARL
jgi:hypothetical protein